MIVQKTESGIFEPVDGNITISASVVAGLPDETLAQLALYRVDEPVIPAGKREIGPRTYVMQDGKVTAVLLLGDISPPAAPAVLEYGDLWVTDTAFAGGAKRSKHAEVTDDSWPAFEEAKQAIIADRVGDGGRNFRVPHGYFYLSQPFEMNEAGFNLIGSGGGMAGGNATVLRWPAGSHGIIVGRHNTVGLEPADSHGIGGDGSRVEDMLLWSRGQSTGTPHNGITLLARAILRNIYAAAWPQAGIQTIAPIGPNAGNANCFRIEGGRSAYNGRYGLHVSNSDANAGLVMGLDVTQNGSWGIFDNSFLGSTYIGCHSDQNGWSVNGITTAHARVYHEGFVWLVRLGQDEGASTSEPGQNPAAWAQIYASSGPGAGIPQWEEGQRYQSGGAYASLNQNARNLFLGCYSESGQPPSQILAPSYVVGGMHAAGLSRDTSGIIDGTFTGGLTLRKDELTVELAQNVGNGDILALQHPEHIQQVNRLRFENHNLVWDIGNSTDVFRITQPGSLFGFGYPTPPVGAFHPRRLIVSTANGLDGRMIDYGDAPPPAAEGYQPRGRLRFNISPAPGGDFAWSCVEAGVPGVWASVGKIAVQ